MGGKHMGTANPRKSAGCCWGYVHSPHTCRPGSFLPTLWSPCPSETSIVQSRNVRRKVHIAWTLCLLFCSSPAGARLLPLLSGIAGRLPPDISEQDSDDDDDALLGTGSTGSTESTGARSSGYVDLRCQAIFRQPSESFAFNSVGFWRFSIILERELGCPEIFYEGSLIRQLLLGSERGVDVRFGVGHRLCSCSEGITFGPSGKSLDGASDVALSFRGMASTLEQAWLSQLLPFRQRYLVCFGACPRLDSEKKRLGISTKREWQWPFAGVGM